MLLNGLSSLTIKGSTFASILLTKTISHQYGSGLLASQILAFDTHFLK